jgi:hypothetical protein
MACSDTEMYFHNLKNSLCILPAVCDTYKVCDDFHRAEFERLYFNRAPVLHNYPCWKFYKGSIAVTGSPGISKGTFINWKFGDRIQCQLFNYLTLADWCLGEKGKEKIVIVCKSFNDAHIDTTWCPSYVPVRSLLQAAVEWQCCMMSELDMLLRSDIINRDFIIVFNRTIVDAAAFFPVIDEHVVDLFKGFYVRHFDIWQMTMPKYHIFLTRMKNVTPNSSGITVDTKLIKDMLAHRSPSYQVNFQYGSVTLFLKRYQSACHVLCRSAYFYLAPSETKFREIVGWLFNDQARYLPYRVEFNV